MANDTTVTGSGGQDDGAALITVWVVRDPSPRSTMSDICWPQRVATLDRYILGCPAGAWAGERHTVYLTKEAAESDARKRLASTGRA